MMGQHFSSRLRSICVWRNFCFVVTSATDLRISFKVPDLEGSEKVASHRTLLKISIARAHVMCSYCFDCLFAAKKGHALESE